MNCMNIAFSAVLDNVSFARTVVSAFLTPLNPTVDEVIEWKTIVSEGVSNAIIHGYNYDSSKSVYMSMYIDEYIVTLEIEDYGLGIENIDKVKRPFYTTRENVEHAGMGLTIIDTLCDSLDIESVVNDGTRLIIKKEMKSYGGI